MQSGTEQASNGEGPERKSFKDRFLHSDYFYIHAEPHRRQPTLVTFPRFITHTATLFSKDFSQDAFGEWLTVFNDEAWRRRTRKDPYPWDDDAVARNIVDSDRSDSREPLSKVWDRFKLIAYRFEEEELLKEPSWPSDENVKDKDVEFVIELVHREHREVVARIAAHLEFFTLTLFKPLCRFDVTTVFTDYGPQLVPEDDVENSNPFHRVYDELATKFPKSTFANFKGVVVPLKAFGRKSVDAQRLFPHGDAGPLTADHAKSTAIFLRTLKTEFRKSLFEAGQDVIACYFQRAQAIYLSALGAQKSPHSQDELRYLVIYNDAPLENGGEDDEASNRYRLSRLVHRINSIGTLRLSALRDLRQLRYAANELRRIETYVETAAHALHPRHHKLHHMISRLEWLVREFARRGTPLLYRTARARLYFDQMKKMLEDLGAQPIPEWQSYDQFLRRRLFAQHEFTASLGNRISRLWAVARSSAEVAEAEALRWLEHAARWASLILVPAAFADMLHQHTPMRLIVGAVLRTIGFDVRPRVTDPWHLMFAAVPAEIRNWWGLPDTQEFWLVFILTFCGWGLFVHLYLKRLREFRLTRKSPN